jgi:hypothetical protein
MKPSKSSAAAGPFQATLVATASIAAVESRFFLIFSLSRRLSKKTLRQNATLNNQRRMTGVCRFEVKRISGLALTGSLWIATARKPDA